MIPNDEEKNLIEGIERTLIELERTVEKLIAATRKNLLEDWLSWENYSQDYEQTYLKYSALCGEQDEAFRLDPWKVQAFADLSRRLHAISHSRRPSLASASS